MGASARKWKLAKDCLSHVLHSRFIWPKNYVLFLKYLHLCICTVSFTFKICNPIIVKFDRQNRIFFRMIRKIFPKKSLEVLRNFSFVAGSFPNLVSGEDFKLGNCWKIIRSLFLRFKNEIQLLICVVDIVWVITSLSFLEVTLSVSYWTFFHLESLSASPVSFSMK